MYISTSKFKAVSFFLALLVMACAIGYILTRPTEDARIRAYLNELTSASSFENSTLPLDQLSKAAAFSALFAPDIKVNLLTSSEERQVISSSKEIKDKAVAVQRYLAQLATTLIDPQIVISGNEATVEGLARALGREHGRSDYFMEEHKVRFKLVKIGGNWRINFAMNTEPYDLDEAQ